MSRTAKGKYEYWLTEEGLIKLEGWARDGLTDKQIAQNAGITESTVAKGKAEQADIRKIFKFVLKYPEFKGRASQNGGAVELIFWNPAFDKEIIL